MICTWRRCGWIMKKVDTWSEDLSSAAHVDRVIGGPPSHFPNEGLVHPITLSTYVQLSRIISTVECKWCGQWFFGSLFLIAWAGFYYRKCGLLCGNDAFPGRIMIVDRRLPWNTCCTWNLMEKNIFSPYQLVLDFWTINRIISVKHTRPVWTWTPSATGYNFTWKTVNSPQPDGLGHDSKPSTLNGKWLPGSFFFWKIPWLRIDQLQLFLILVIQGTRDFLHSLKLT